MAKMTDDTLLKHLQANEDDAAQYVEAVGYARLASMREYYREPYPGDEELDGWSQIVTSEVQDTVEWILPELLDVFTTSDEAVVFEPTTQEDVQGAQQATDTCNYIFYKQNNGFLTLYTAFKDALIAQNCAVMWRTCTDQVREVQKVNGAPIEVLAMLEAEGYEIEAASPVMGALVPLFNASVARTVEKKKIRVEAFPPEQMIIKKGWTSPLLADCPYVARVMEVTLSDLRQMGFKDVTAAELRASEDALPDSLEEDYRIQRTEGKFTEDGDSVDTEDESLATGWLRIEFVLVDYDGDGIAERRLIYRLHDKILENEETDQVQIATTSPIINTHRWDGMSIAECVSDIQRLKTDLTRAMVNGANLAVNPRKTVLTDANGNPYVDVDDLLDFRVGGIVRQTRENALSVEPTPFNPGQVLPVLAYVDDMAEKRTGVSKQQQGLDVNALRPDRTAAEVMMTANAAKQRVKLIARIFAETLVKPVFMGILKLLTQGEMEPLAFRLRGQFVQYDPNEWRDQYDMTVNVGLGTGDKQQQIGVFTNLLQTQMGLAQSPFGQLMIQPQHIYNTVAKMVELGGQKNVNDFIANPQGQPLPQPGPPPQLMLEQAKMQQQGQIKQMELQFQAQAAEMDRRQQAELELIRQRAQQQTDANRQAMEAELHRMKLAQEAEVQALRAQYDDARHVREMAYKRWEAELDASVKIESANISSKAKVANEATAAATAEIGREVRP
ncbi:hypothetical protein [Acidovorax sp.]|uniref:portal protein n=1 Tax=Acidovorax sp. TaxID=1872122 RepID=UPI00391A36F2